MFIMFSNLSEWQFCLMFPHIEKRVGRTGGVQGKAHTSAMLIYSAPFYFKLILGPQGPKFLTKFLGIF